ncbi:MAG: DsbA family protein [Cyanophyceae cyanobacterium]
MPRSYDTSQDDSLRLLIRLLSTEKLLFLTDTFGKFDLDNSGTLDIQELGEVLRSLGRHYSDDQIRAAVSTVANTSSLDAVSFEQFAALMQFDVVDSEADSHSAYDDDSDEAPIKILYFFDVLCVWSYIAQVRIEELKSTFKQRVALDYHCVPVFGDTQQKFETQWGDRGGLQGYSEHIHKIASQFSHITLHPNVWLTNTPQSSTTCHVFLKAVQLLGDQGIIDVDPMEQPVERAIAACRTAFFTEARDVSNRQVQFEIAEALGFSTAELEKQINSGAAYAALSRDFNLVRDYDVNVSPTMIFNEGRQRLNGNVGYRIIEANIRELIYSPPMEASWC